MISNDSSTKAPPSGGLYDYNTFKPGSGGFPGLVGTYTDPVFGATNTEGSVITRLTADDPTATPGQDIYGHHWLNADGSSFMWQHPGGSHSVFKVSDGSLIQSGLPGGGDKSWHPTDPNAFLYFSGSDLRKYNVSAGTSSLVHTFPSALQSCGGSIDFVDRTGQFFCIQYGGAGHVYDATANVVYSGATSGAPGGGYWCMAPDAAFAYLVSGGVFTAYALDNVNHVVAAGFPFWQEDAGDHAGFCSASDGNNYMIRQDNHSNGFFYRVKVQDETGRTATQMRTDSPNTIILQEATMAARMSNHVSGVGRGTFQDWIFVNTEDAADHFDNSTFGGVWKPYEQEIIAFNVLTLEYRRLAHHRSRGLYSPYDSQPRVSCAWDGSAVMWASNFNLSVGGAGYVDAWAIKNPLGADSGGGNSPLNESDWFTREAQTNPLRISRW